MRPQTIEVDGLSLAALTAGDLAKPALVLLHGWPQCKELYDQVIDPLAESGHFVIALLTDPRIWHFAFHAIPELPETLVTGHQRRYFDYFIEMLAGRREAVNGKYRSAFAKAYASPDALKAGFDWYRAMAADAKRNSQAKPIHTPLLLLRGDADGRTPDDYVAGLKKAGAQNVSSGVLRDSGEFAPIEAPQAFMKAIIAFSAQCSREPVLR